MANTRVHRDATAATSASRRFIFLLLSVASTGEYRTAQTPSQGAPRRRCRRWNAPAPLSTPSNPTPDRPPECHDWTVRFDPSSVDGTWRCANHRTIDPGPLRLV